MKKTGMYGKKHSEEAKKKIGDANRGKKRNKTHRKNMSDAKKRINCHTTGMYGKRHADESKNKTSDSLKKHFANNPMNDETKMKISKRLKTIWKGKRMAIQ